LCSATESSSFTKQTDGEVVRRATANPNPRTEQRRRAHLMDGGRGRRGGGPPSPAGSIGRSFLGSAMAAPGKVVPFVVALCDCASIVRVYAQVLPLRTAGRERRLLPPARRRRREGGGRRRRRVDGVGKTRVKEAAGRVGRVHFSAFDWRFPATFAYPAGIAINASSACDARRFPICRLLVFLQK
jgi:hypothetical protein